MLAHYFDPNGPGAALAVVRDGAAPMVECTGLADVECRVPITPDTAFELGSASKTFTAVAVLLAAERGCLDLSSPVGAYLPTWRNGVAGRLVTVADLLRHTSGLHDYLEAGPYQTPLDELRMASVLDRLPDWSHAASPGFAFHYSNTNYVVLARLLETVTGRPFAEYVAEYLVRPFGLCSTAVDPERQTPSVGVARGYHNRGFGLPYVVPSTPCLCDTYGDGGMISTLNDLIRWQSLFWEGKILAEPSLRLMRSRGRLDSGDQFDYGMGLQVEEQERGETWCGHGGSWTDATTLIGRYTNARTTIIVLSNEFMAPVERIAQRAFASMRNREQQLS